MLENLYTTKMSANKKTLQNRFTKIRSKNGRLSKIMALVMSVAIAVTMLCATVVMAAFGSDGLEYWDKNEVYILGSMRLSVDADIENAPQWIKDISSDGKLTLMINKTDMRDTSGLVTHSNTATVNGNKGKETLTRIGTSSYYNVVKYDTEYDWDVMLFTYNITDNGNIDTDNIYVNCKKNRFICTILHWKYKKISIKYGFSIPINTFGPGLRIIHRGTIVVNPGAKIGANARVNCDVVIGAKLGTNKESPTIGKNCYFSPGCKIFGNITVGDNVIIASNAVVTENVESDVTVGGVPARVISYKSTKEIFKYFV